MFDSIFLGRTVTSFEMLPLKRVRIFFFLVVLLRFTAGYIAIAAFAAANAAAGVD